MRVVVAALAGSAWLRDAVRGMVGALFPAPFLRRCADTRLARRLRTSCSMSCSPSLRSASSSSPAADRSAAHASSSQEITLVHFSAQRKRFLLDKGYLGGGFR